MLDCLIAFNCSKIECKISFVSPPLPGTVSSFSPFSLSSFDMANSLARSLSLSLSSKSGGKFNDDPRVGDGGGSCGDLGFWEERGGGDRDELKRADAWGETGGRWAGPG